MAEPSAVEEEKNVRASNLPRAATNKDSYHWIQTTQQFNLNSHDDNVYICGA